MVKARFLGLDGLRGVCALTVVLLHSELLFNSGVVFCHGYLAVDMFFILSGFVISASYDERFAAGMPIRKFLAVRVRRLAPVYWAGLALCVASALLVAWYRHSPPAGAIVLHGIMAFALVPHLGPRSFAYPADAVAWTLAWEIVVNIVYAKWLRRLSTPLLSALIAGLLALAIAESLVNPRGWSFGMTGLDIWFGGLRTFPEFLMGVVLFRSFRAGWLARLPPLTPLLPLALWLAIAVIPGSMSPLLDAALVVFACPLLIALLVRGEAQAPQWFAPLGAVSYPLYASHLALIGLAQHTPLLGLDRHPRPLLAAGVVLLAVGVAWVIHLVADPARNRAKKPPETGFFSPEPAISADG